MWFASVYRITSSDPSNHPIRCVPSPSQSNGNRIWRAIGAGKVGESTTITITLTTNRLLFCLQDTEKIKRVGVRNKVSTQGPKERKEGSRSWEKKAPSRLRQANSLARTLSAYLYHSPISFDRQEVGTVRRPDRAHGLQQIRRVKQKPACSDCSIATTTAVASCTRTLRTAYR